MDRVLQNFVEGVRESPDTDSMRAVMADAIVAFDLRRFTYFSPAGGHRGASIFISTYDTSWTDHYFAQGYDSIDPVFSRALALEKPFQWGKDVATTDMSRPQKRLFDEAASFGIRNGFTMPLACRSGAFAALTLVADERPTTFKRIVDRNLRALQLIAITFHTAVRRKRWITQSVNGVPLTRREIECLHWKSQGKSAWDISQIVGISHCTVAFHLENAKAKLGVRTVCQAVALYAADSP